MVNVKGQVPVFEDAVVRRTGFAYLRGGEVRWAEQQD